MNKKRLYLFAILLVVPTFVAAQVVELRSGDELHGTNLTFKINNTIGFSSPIKISNTGYAEFGNQNISFEINTGQINVTILNYTNSSGTSTGSNFWIFLQGQDETINISINNMPGDSRYVAVTDSSKVITTVIASDYLSDFSFERNATSAGEYIEFGFSYATTTTLSSGGGSGGSSGSTITGAATTTPTTTLQETATTVPTTVQPEVIPTTVIPTTLAEEKKAFKLPSLKVGTIVVLIIVTASVIVWLVRSL